MKNKEKIIFAFKFGVKKSYPWWKKFMAYSIKLWTFSIYYHCEFIYKDHWYTADFKNGIKKFPLKPIDFKNYDYIVFDIENKYIKRLEEYLELAIGKKYDWCGIFFSNFLGVKRHDMDKWTCHEFCGDVAIAANIMKYTNTYRLNPGKLWNKLETIKDESFK